MAAAKVAAAKVAAEREAVRVKADLVNQLDNLSKLNHKTGREEDWVRNEAAEIVLGQLKPMSTSEEIKKFCANENARQEKWGAENPKEYEALERKLYPKNYEKPEPEKDKPKTQDR